MARRRSGRTVSVRWIMANSSEVTAKNAAGVLSTKPSVKPRKGCKLGYCMDPIANPEGVSSLTVQICLASGFVTLGCDATQGGRAALGPRDGTLSAFGMVGD